MWIFLVLFQKVRYLNIETLLETNMIISFGIECFDR